MGLLGRPSGQFVFLKTHVVMNDSSKNGHTKMSRLKSMARLASVLSIAGFLTYGSSASAEQLSVCIDKASPTKVSEESLANAVAKHGQVELKINYFDSSDDDDGISARELAKLAKRCDLILGYPVDADADSIPDGFFATAPYGHTGFVLMTRHGNAADSLDTLSKGSKVAVTYGTVANLYLLKRPGLQPNVVHTDEDSLQALKARTVDAAIVWKPTLSKGLEASGAYDLHEIKDPHARFNVVALYSKPHEEAAKVFNASVNSLSQNGTLTKMLDPAVLPGHAAAEKSDGVKVTQVAEAAAPAASGSTAAAPAIFTAAQAEAGKAKFLPNCSMCHGPTLAGRSGPALKGPTFANEKAGFHVGDVFTIVAQNMPATNPGSLEKDDYVEIMAYILQENGYPAGDTALTYDDAMKSSVPLIYRGK